MAATITAVAFAVTGINDKINRAAANVFGEDLVKVANIAGTVFAAYNGGFSLDSAAETTAQGADAINGLDSVSPTVDVAANATELADAGGQIIQDTMTTAYDASPASMDGLDVAADVASQSAPSVNLADIQKQALMQPEKVAVEPPKFEVSGAAAERTPVATDYSQGGPSTGTGLNGGGKGVTDSWSLADLKKYVIDPKTGNISNGALQFGGNVLQGAFGSYSAAKAREQAQANYDAQLARQARLANLGTAGWKQTQ